VLATGVVLLVGAQIAALGSEMLSGLALAQRDWTLLALLPIGFALLAAFAARIAVLGALRRTL
jgi:cell division transport system permease protein